MTDTEPHNDENPLPLDIDLFRGPSELPHHWQLRRSFLLAHKEKFSPDRLICLSHVFVNVECMGTKYAEEVMEKVKELGSDVDKSMIHAPTQHEQLEKEQEQQQYHHQRHFNQRNSSPRIHPSYQERHSSPTWQRNYAPAQQRYSVPRQYPTPQSRYSAPAQHRHVGPPQNRYNNSGPYQPRPRYGRPFQQQDQRNRGDR